MDAPALAEGALIIQRVVGCMLDIVVLAACRVTGGNGLLATVRQLPQMLSWAARTSFWTCRRSS
jgi:hypothetical protein